MFGDYPHNAPAEILEQFQPFDIAAVLPRIVPVLLAVVLDPHLPLWPAHVDSTPSHLDLRRRTR
jgi:hypothetical protein